MVLVRRECGTTVNLGSPSAYQMQKRTIPKTSIMPHIEMILISTASIWKIKTLRCNYRKEREGKKMREGTADLDCKQRRWEALMWGVSRDPALVGKKEGENAKQEERGERLGFAGWATITSLCFFFFLRWWVGVGDTDTRTITAPLTESSGWNPWDKTHFLDQYYRDDTA